jgi:long-chain acyl-CoA synthetase
MNSRASVADPATSILENAVRASHAPDSAAVGETEPFDAAAWDAAVRQGTGVTYVALRTPDRPAVVGGAGGDRTFAELDAEANQLVRALRRRGLTAGDGVAVLCGNRAEFVVVWAACSRAGFRLTTVNWHLTPAEAAYIVDDCRARAFVADATHGESVPAAEGTEVRIAVGGAIDGFEAWDDVLAVEPTDAVDDPTLGSAMLYTSGTTGYPKGVDKPTDADALVISRLVYGYSDGDVHLCTGPLYHAAPFTIALTVPVTAGVTLVLMERWDAEAALRLIEQHRVTHLHLVPTMFHRLLALPDEVKGRHDLSSLKVAVHGAAPCPVPVKRAMIEWWGPIISEYYAATEGAGTAVDSTTWLRKPGTVGMVDPTRVYVGDDDGAPLAVDEEGLVWLLAAGSQRFTYFGDAAKTAGAFRGDFFTLGDVGRIDDEGFLFLTDRTANLIISGGVNIYPAEIDAVLLQHPAVGDVGVIGVPDDEWGETVLAVVELRAGATATEAELLAFCRDRLARFKCPRAVEFVEHLPRDENGKLYKRRLREDRRPRGNA